MADRGLVSYSTPLDDVLGMLERVEENGGYVRLSPVGVAGETIRLLSVVDVIDALAEGKLVKDGLYRAEYVPELAEED